MEDKKQSEQNVSVPKTEAPVSDSALIANLVQLLLAERKEALEEKKERERARQAREAQRRINSEYAIAEKLNIQKLCTHKKGGRGLKSPKVDYAVYFHTFTDATSYIRCQICGMKWRNVDTPEYLIRRGKKIPNHTGIGWKEAYQMVAESTNTASSSEVQLSAKPIEVNVADLE
jgi:hypothetical protein